MLRFAMCAFFSCVAATAYLLGAIRGTTPIDASSIESVTAGSGGWLPPCPVLRTWTADYDNCHSRGPGDPRDEPIGLAAPLPSDAEFALLKSQCGGQVRLSVTYEEGDCDESSPLAPPRLVDVMSVIENNTDDPWSVFMVDLTSCFSDNRPLPPHLYAIIGFGVDSPVVLQVKGRVSTHLSCCQNCGSGG